MGKRIRKAKISVGWKSIRLLHDTQLSRSIANALLSKQKYESEKKLAENEFRNHIELQSYFDKLRKCWLADLRDNLIEYEVMPHINYIEVETTWRKNDN